MVSKILKTVKLFIVLYRNFFGKKCICVAIVDRFITAMYKYNGHLYIVISVSLKTISQIISTFKN